MSSLLIGFVASRLSVFFMCAAVLTSSRVIRTRRYHIHRSRGERSATAELSQDRKAELGIFDLQLGLKTLEVFLTISSLEALGNAAAEVRFKTLIVNGKTLKVIGGQEVRIPGSVLAVDPHGMMVEVFWQQDDVGALKIARQSEPKPAAEVLDEGRDVGAFHFRNKKRIVPARLHDGSGTATPADPQGQFAFLLAPPSSPASRAHSMAPSSVQSPFHPPTCPVPQGGGSRIPLETQSNMFVIGPYAHETALVSPPAFSSFTTAQHSQSSTAPFTPPPELAAQFTRPPSPDVPFAKLLASSFSDQRSAKREPEPPYSASPFASPDYYQQDQNQQDDLQVAYQLYPGSPLGRTISPAGTTGASTPFGGQGTTGTTTPHPETDNPTPLTVLPAVVSILPNLEHQVAEGLHQRSILDSQCGRGEPLSDSGREKMGSFDGNSRFMGALFHEHDMFDSNSNSIRHELYNGSLSGLNEVLEARNGYSKLKQDKSPRHTALESEEEFEVDIREGDFLELRMLSGTESPLCDSRPSPSPSGSSRFQSKVGSKACSNVGSKAESKAGSKIGSKTGSDALKEWDHNEENLLEYALSLLEGTDGNRQGTIGWAPVDTSLSRESEASVHLENWTVESRANSLRVNSTFKIDQNGKYSTGVPQETITAAVREVPGETNTPVEHHGREPGCCSRCESLVSRCEQLSMALKEAEIKQMEKERLAEEREQQIRHLTQLLQFGGLKKFVGNFSRSCNQEGKDNKVEDTL